MYKKKIEGNYIVSTSYIQSDFLIEFLLFICYLGISSIQDPVSNILRDGNGDAEDDEEAYEGREGERVRGACHGRQEGAGVGQLRPILQTVSGGTEHGRAPDECVHRQAQNTLFAKASIRQPSIQHRTFKARKFAVV